MATKKKVSTKQFKDDLEAMLFCYQTVIGDLDNTIKMIEDQGVKIPAKITKGYRDASVFLKTVHSTYKRLGAEIDKIDEKLPSTGKNIELEDKPKTRAKKSAPVKTRATEKKSVPVKTKKATAKNKAKVKK